MKKKYLMGCLTAALLASSMAYADERKDCNLHVIASDKNATGNGLAYKEVENQRLKGDVTKDTCLNHNKIKKDACDKLDKQCAAAPTTTPLGKAGMAGGWVQWGTSSRENCPKVCPGFEGLNAVGYSTQTPPK